MSVLTSDILLSQLPKVEKVSKLSYGKVFFRSSVKPCDKKQLSRYAYLSVVNDYYGDFSDHDFQCVTGSMDTNVSSTIKISKLELVSLTTLCSGDPQNNTLIFIVNVNCIIDGVITAGGGDGQFVDVFLQYQDTDGIWKYVLDSNTGQPFYMDQNGDNTFSPVAWGDGDFKFRLILNSTNRVSPVIIVNVVHCFSAPPFIIQENSAYILQENTYRIKPEQ